MKLRLVDTKKAVIYVLMLAMSLMSLMSLPVQANSLVYDPFVRDATNRQNFEPGGKYHLFGSRGSTTDRKGKISVIPTASQNIGGLSLEQALIRGNITYNVKFSGHGHEVHGPFDNHASKSSSDKKGQALIGFTTYQLSWKGHEHHPADAYDGPQGSNFPAPTGARDEYSYGISGSAARVQVNFNDNRDTGQRFKDRVENAKNSVTEGTKDAWNKATTHNPELNRAGNAAEVVSAAAAGAGNFIGAGWELLGAGDVAQGASTLKDIAGMEALRALPPEEQLKAVRAITGAADGYDAANAAYARWAQQNPNAAAVMGAAGNIAEQAVNKGGKYRGGKHGETKTPRNDGLDSHHCPAKDCYKNSNIKPDDGPAIQMEPGDHRRTESYGSYEAARSYRAEQERLLNKGKLKEAIDMDIQDIRSKFGSKYDEAIQEMLDYANTLDSNKFRNKGKSK